VVGTETGTMGEKGVVGKGAGRVRERMIRRGAARRDVVGVVLNLTGGTDPVVLPDADLTRRTNPTVLPDATPIPMRRGIDHTVLLDVPNALTDPAHHVVALILLILHLPPDHPPLSHPRWTNISRKRTTLA